jgi:hypothetical protein
LLSTDWIVSRDGDFREHAKDRFCCFAIKNIKAITAATTEHARKTVERFNESTPRRSDMIFEATIDEYANVYLILMKLGCRISVPVEEQEQ